MKKLGIIGAGSIAPAHIEAAKLAGFQVVAVCGRSNSERAKELANMYLGVAFCPSFKDIQKFDIDAVTIAVSVESTYEVLDQIIDWDLPILVEKPVTSQLHEFDSLLARDNPRIMVAFNRRYYSSVIAFQRNLKSLENGLIQIDIPEMAWSKNFDLLEFRRYLLQNSVHVFDLIQYLFGEIEIVDILRSKNTQAGLFRLISFTTRSEFIGTINLSFTTPNNFSIRVLSHSRLLELKPLESFNSYSGIEKHIDSPSGLAVYNLTSDIQWKIDDDDKIVKPGFLKMYKEFLKLTESGQKPITGASIRDAKSAVELALRIGI